MKVQDFKLFKERVAEADRNDIIWWCGSQFMNLTNKQAKIIISVLKQNPVCKVTECGVRIPSGLELYEVKGV